MHSDLRLTLAAFAVLFLLMQVACKKEDSSPTQPTNANVGGTWSGTGSDNSGPGTFTFALTQNGTNVSGTWSARDSQTGITVNGTLSGTVSGNNFQGQMIGGALNCVVTVSFTASISGSSMSGTYSGTSSCAGAVTNGRFNLTKQ
jgi:hypothetical protein